MATQPSQKEKLLIGRDEWCKLPDLQVRAIKAKIDTGAKTSALHAFNIRRVKINNKSHVKFDIHPLQGDSETTVSCVAPILDQRHIMSSSGHIEHRYVIKTTLVIGNLAWSIEVTLSNRDPLRYRLLLGREALNSRVLIDPSLTCYQKKLRKLKTPAVKKSREKKDL